MARVKRIGAMTKSRGDWGDIKPVTQIIADKKKVNDRKKSKNKLKKYIPEKVGD